MWINLLIQIYAWVVSLFSYVPDWQIPVTFTNALQEFMNYGLAMNGLFPVVIALKVIAVCISFDIAIWILRILISAFNFMRGSSGMNI